VSTVLPLQRPADAEELAAALLAACAERRVFAFHGELGAGKTTVIKALCAQLGVEQGMASPSFAIVNEYRTTTDEPVYHFDLYRLKEAAELASIGFREYLDSGHYCFVEWPELAKAELPIGTVDVRIHVAADEGRIIVLDMIPAPSAMAPPL
jgi:tRNA threonylcarbamoyladenosine biosynthesis protein TsaE